MLTEQNLPRKYNQLKNLKGYDQAMSKSDIPLKMQAPATVSQQLGSWFSSLLLSYCYEDIWRVDTVVKVVTSRIYCHAAWHLGRPHLLSRFVVNGSEIQSKSYIWVFFQVGARILDDSGFKGFSHTSRGAQVEPMGCGKEILELLLTVGFFFFFFLTSLLEYNCFTILC